MSNENNIKITAFYIAESIKIKAVKQNLTATLAAETSSDLLYKLDSGALMYIFEFGVVVFANFSEIEMSQHIVFLQPYCVAPENKMRENFEIKHGNALKFNFNTIEVPELNDDVAKIVMYNTAQSVALDHYEESADKLLSEVKGFTTQLEKTGTMKISRKNMLRFIGKALNDKNSIVENLYIFDNPDSVWEDKNLNEIHRGLVKQFDITQRFREIEYTFKVIEDNLVVFRELYMHRESAMLEWIIIVLILIEIIDLFVSKVWK
jgi:required for meiotic nuclear division protein 1